MRKISVTKAVDPAQKKAMMQLARIKAIQCRVQPFVFEKFTEYYKIYRKHELGDDVSKRISSLLLAEKIFQKLDFNLVIYSPEVIKLRLLNAFMLTKSFTSL